MAFGVIAFNLIMVDLEEKQSATTVPHPQIAYTNHKFQPFGKYRTTLAPRRPAQKCADIEIRSNAEYRNNHS